MRSIRWVGTARLMCRRADKSRTSHARRNVACSDWLPHSPHQMRRMSCTVIVIFSPAGASVSRCSGARNRMRRSSTSASIEATARDPVLRGLRSALRERLGAEYLIRGEYRSVAAIGRIRSQRPPVLHTARVAPGIAPRPLPGVGRGARDSHRRRRAARGNESPPRAAGALARRPDQGASRVKTRDMMPARLRGSQSCRNREYSSSERRASLGA
jgi:hypothetical protein